MTEQGTTIDIKGTIQTVVDGRELTTDEATATMDAIMTGQVTGAQIGALVTALRMRGETVGEIAGFATAMRRHALRVAVADGDGPLVVREKTHAAVPMTLDQALHEMELVGHDFFLFVDHDSAEPSVVYRRRGYDYGVVRLSL